MIAVSLQLCDKCYLLPALQESCKLAGSPRAQGFHFQEGYDSFKIVIFCLDVMMLKGYPVLPLFLAHLSLFSLFFLLSLFICQFLSSALFPARFPAFALKLVLPIHFKPLLLKSLCWW